MSKRTDRIRSLFAAPTDGMLSADNAPVPPARVSAGSVRSLKDTFSDVERENETLRGRLAAASLVIEVDPALVDPSPVTDRFLGEDAATFEALKASIAQRGQEVPILIREHPTVPGRYQSAYGHRRVRAARDLGRPVQAVLRVLSDEDLVVAQGLENAAREDLSFIERAVFAARLEEAGHARAVVQDALSVDRAEASKLVSVARAVPADIVAAIGRAPKVGRGRWLALAEALGEDGATARARTAASAQGFQKRDSDARFLAVLAAAGPPVQGDPRPSAGTAILAATGERIARARQSGRDLTLTLERRTDAAFAAYVIEQLPRLFATYVDERPAKTEPGAASPRSRPS